MVRTPPAAARSTIRTICGSAASTERINGSASAWSYSLIMSMTTRAERGMAAAHATNSAPSAEERAGPAGGRAGHRAVRHQPADLVLAVAGGAQHLLGVLAQRRARKPVRVARRARELDRDAEHADRRLRARL